MSPASATSGFVYLFRVAARFKIGRSKWPGSRLDAVAPRKRHDDAEIVHVFASADSGAVERTLHRRFAASSLGGEWFSLESHEVDAICRVTRADSPHDLPQCLQSEPLATDSLRIARDLMEILREICFHTRDHRDRRLKVTQYLDGLMRPVILREYRAFKARQEKEANDAD